MTRATRVMLEQYEVRIESLKSQYKSLKKELEMMDDESVCYESNAISILISMKDLKDEYRTLENVVFGIRAANEERWKV